MFWSLVSLLVLALVVRGIVFAVRWFVAWLGRGKPIQRAAEDRELPQEVRDAARELDYYYRLKGYRELIGKPLKLSRAQLSLLAQRERVVRDDRVDHMRIGWYQVVILFIVGSVGGLLLEQLWMFETHGLTE